MRRALLAAVALLVAPVAASASHVPGATYEGVVTSGQGGTVTLEVSLNGKKVNAAFNGLGNVSGTCTGVGFETGQVPVTDHSFSYTSPNSLVTANGSFGKSSVIGGAQVLTTPCTTGSQSWHVRGPDAFLGTSLGLGVLNAGGAGQTDQRSAARGENQTFEVGLDNAGTEPDTFLLKGCRSSAGFKVTYADGSGNVTAEVTEGSYETAELAPGPESPDLLNLDVKVRNSADPGDTKTCKVKADSGLLVDAVKAKVKATRN